MTHAEAVVLVRGLAPRFLEGLSPSEHRLLFETATLEEFGPGSLITRQGFPASSIGLLIQGRARFTCTTLAGRKLNLRWIYPGEICGVAALLSHPHNYLLSAEVVRASVALVWNHADIRSFAADCPQLIDNGLTLTFDYIRLYQISHICATTQTARQRLALVLGAVAEAIGRKEKGGIEMDIRNEDLANDANLTVFTASRLLNEWQREGILVKTRGKILLRSPQALLRLGA
jgi:CRP/FNR family transcriptional regulator, nitrogen oxide reductase regulator